jgi:hypothetical protein
MMWRIWNAALVRSMDFSNANTRKKVLADADKAFAMVCGKADAEGPNGPILVDGFVIKKDGTVQFWMGHINVG